MQVMSNGRVRRTEQEWRELLARCDHANLTASEFCRRERIHLTSFLRWRTRLVCTARPSDFTALTRAAAPETATTPWSFEIVLPSGHKLRIEG